MAWLVALDTYSLEPGDVGKYLTPVARFRHRTRKAACRRLASILSGRKGRAAMPYANARKFYIIAPDGQEFALRPCQRLTD